MNIAYLYAFLGGAIGLGLACLIIIIVHKIRK